MNKNYEKLETPQPHVARSREILNKYPQARDLMGPYPLTFVAILFICFIQIGLGYLLADKSWWLIWAVAFFIGAILNHGMFALVHEAAHNLIFKKSWANQIAGIICNIPQAFPSSEGFRIHHLIHHSNMGEYDKDADLAHHAEAKLIGNNWFMKILWFAGFLIVEAIRPIRFKDQKTLTPWVLFNTVVILGTDYLIFKLFGFKALAYLMISSFFSVGLHPVGARWIQEHYVFKKGQETYSYYGILNTFAFNVGMHNEHHDLFRVPWINLPKLKAMAPEYYDTLYYHTSWTKLLLRFIFDNKLDLYSRYIREPKNKKQDFNLSSSKTDLVTEI